LTQPHIRISDQKLLHLKLFNKDVILEKNVSNTLLLQ